MRKVPWKTILALMGVGTVALVCGCASLVGPCWSSWIGDGVLLDTCPRGSVRPVATIQGSGLGRKDEGSVIVGVVGHYVTDWGSFQTTPVRRFSPTLVLVGPDGTETELEPEEGWDGAWDGGDWDGGWDHQQLAKIKLPDGPDGDYKLRFTADSPAGEATVEAPLPLYQPALAHVLTDSPLYKPGQTVQFRGVLLGAADLAPLDGRPVTWRVLDPAGELLLEEKGKTGAFGVVSGSFPLADDAESGAWTVELVSGAATDRATVDVRPFQLPRATVEARTEQPYWQIGQDPVVTGSVRYTSGAPVANAAVRIVARADGEWPPPTEWLAERTLTTDARGGFSFHVGTVPGDLRGKATLRYSIEATDETGDVIVGGASVLLSEDTVSAEAVTELPGGMVPNANNRVYVRVTSPEGRILPGAQVKLTREWDPRDPGEVTLADADGVARFQLDPGAPTTVVVPPMPVRPQPRAEVTAVSLGSAEDALTGESVDLEAQVALDRWARAIRPCADRVEPEGSASVEASVLLGPNGAVRMVDAFEGGERTAAARCVAERIRGQSGPGGRERLWTVSWNLQDPGSPWVEASVSAQAGTLDGLTELVDDALKDSRACVAGLSGDATAFPRAWRLTVDEGSTRVGMVPVNDATLDGVVSGAAAACVERGLQGLTLPAPAEAGGVGVLTLELSVPSDPTLATPQPTTFPGFAMKVEVLDQDRSVGHTMLRLREGAVPDLRLRWSEVIVDPGATIELAALRGPNFSGGFPKKMWLMQGDRALKEFDFDPEARKATVTLPSDVSGFVHVEYSGARAVLYIRPLATLALGLDTDARGYRPGEKAQLTITAKDGDKPVAAGVTLSGVDSTLATLATLPDPDAFARITVRATSDSPAFGVLDARALQTGQIAGENAAQAAVLRVSGLPTTPPGADRVNLTQVQGEFTPDAELADAFYGLYREARAEVRAWEAATPKTDALTAKVMVALWEKALAAHSTKDPFGRPLHLSALPPDLLALTDPRFMASDGTRLPEDVENWPQFVASEAP